MKILFISPNLPYPPDTGGSIRIFNLIKNLSRDHDIDLLSYDYGSTNAGDLAELKKICAEVHLVKKVAQPVLKQLVDVVLRTARWEPFSIKYAESSDMNRAVAALTAAKRYDIVQIEHSYSAGMHRFIDHSAGARTVLSLHNVASQQYRRMYDHERNPVRKAKLLLDWLPMQSWEPSVAMKFDKLVVVSPTDRETLEGMTGSARIFVVPNGIDTAGHAPLPIPDNKNVMMIGTMDYEPNIDAALYFCESILPLLAQRVPEATLTVVGRNPAPEVVRLGQVPRVTVAADVTDVRSFYAQAAVSAVALRSGGGTRIKILESMALGIPVVSTSIGCEGLEVTEWQDILIADTPAEFAAKLGQVMTDRELAQRLAKNARCLVEEKYDWRQITQELQRVYQQ